MRYSDSNRAMTDNPLRRMARQWMLLPLLLMAAVHLCLPAAVSAEVDDTPTGAFELSIGTRYFGYILFTGDVDWAKVYVPDPGILQASLEVPDGMDYDLALHDANAPSGFILASENAAGDESIDYAVPAAGWYYLRIYGYENSFSENDPFYITVTFTSQVAPVFQVFGNIHNFAGGEDVDQDGYYERFDFQFAVDGDEVNTANSYFVYVKMICETTGIVWWSSELITISGTATDYKYFSFDETDFAGTITGNSDLDFTVELWDTSKTILLARNTVVDGEPVKADGGGTVNDGRVTINGSVTHNGASVCAMVLANGQYMFSCGASNGVYNLTVPLDSNGEITIQAFVSGLAPFKQVVGSATRNIDIAMQTADPESRSTAVTANFSSDASTPSNWVNISGSVTVDGQPLCAMVLANGQYMFTCNPIGTFDLMAPLDNDGEILLYGFCSGLKPFRKVFTSDDMDTGSVDRDGDGYTPAQGDCNDLDSSIHPGAAEIYDDGIDQDCNGRDETSPAP